VRKKEKEEDRKERGKGEVVEWSKVFVYEQKHEGVLVEKIRWIKRFMVKETRRERKKKKRGGKTRRKRLR